MRGRVLWTQSPRTQTNLSPRKPLDHSDPEISRLPGHGQPSDLLAASLGLSIRVDSDIIQSAVPGSFWPHMLSPTFTASAVRSGPPKDVRQTPGQVISLPWALVFSSASVVQPPASLRGRGWGSRLYLGER